jgi:hypothetical protein
VHHVHSLEEARAYLRQRQERNARWLPHIDLLGELNTTPAELDKLGAAISLLVSAAQPAQATQQLEIRYPLAFAEFLVAIGIHEYRQGNYWSAVFRQTRIPAQIYPSRWGQAFERILRHHELEQFEALHGDQALRFVSRFLAHGGIPTSCLDDFFQHLVEPAIRQNRHASLQPQQIIDAWRASPTAFDGVDKPVRRFLLYGGPAARDVLARTLDLADAVLQGTPIPEPEDLGLPARIVDSFADWAKNKHKKQPPAPVPAKRVVRPGLVYDPWASDALSMLLPSEPLPNDAQAAVWHVMAGSWSAKQVVSRMARGGNPVSRAGELRIPHHFSLLEVELESDGQRIRAWTFTGLSRERPLLAFRPSSGQMLDPTKPLPASELWLIVPGASEIAVADGGESKPPRVVEELPLLSGAWARYKGLHVDLTGNRRLSVIHEDVTSSFDLVNPDELHGRPSLVGGALPAFPVADDGSFTYAGSPPHLRLPLPMRGGSRTSPDRWRMRIRSHGTALPQIDVSFSGDDGAFVTPSGTGSLLVDLKHERLLGEHPLGRFEITARGPLGHDGRFELLFMPSTMRVTGTAHMLLPDDNGPFRVHGLAHVSVAPQLSGQVRVIPESPGVFRLNPPDDIDLIPIAGRRDPTGPDEFHLTLALSRMGWTLSGVGDQHSGLTISPVAISRDELEQSATPTLYVALPGAADDLLVGLDVEDASGSVRYAFAPRPAGQGRRFSLREMLDSIGGLHDARLRLVVVLRRDGADTGSMRIPVGFVTRNLRIGALAVADSRLGFERTLSMTWDEPLPVSNRVLRIWNLWRLWQNPITAEIPDSAKGAFEFCQSSLLLPPGKHRVELAVQDPWITASAPTLPRLDDGHCTDVMLGSDEERDDYLAGLPSDDPLAVLEWFLAEGDPQILQRLPETLSGERVHQAIRAILAMVETDDADALIDERLLILAMNELRRALLGHSETLDSIADEARFSAAAPTRLRRLIVELGILEEPATNLYASGLSAPRRRALWHLWPPLLVALDGDGLVADEPEVLDTARNVLGTTVAEWLPGADGHASGRPPDQRGFTFQGTELSLPVHMLSTARDSLPLRPTGPLDDDTWILANFEWLIRAMNDVKTRRRAEAWIVECQALAEDDVERLMGHGVEAAVHAVRARWPTADFGRLRMVPYVVGATALACRALARRVIETSSLIDHTAAHIDAPREAFVTAPELYTRDLCVMDLLLLDWLAKRDG